MDRLSVASVSELRKRRSVAIAAKTVNATKELTKVGLDAGTATRSVGDVSFEWQAMLVPVVNLSSSLCCFVV